MKCDSSLVFQEGDIKKCHNVTLYEDDICEWNNGTLEYFTTHLLGTTGTSNIDVFPPQARVFIDDSNEPECSMWSLFIFNAHVSYFTHTCTVHVCMQVFMLDTADQ